MRRRNTPGAFFFCPSPRRGGMVLENIYNEQKRSQELTWWALAIPSKGVGVQTVVTLGREGGSSSGREMPAVCKK